MRGIAIFTGPVTTIAAKPERIDRCYNAACSGRIRILRYITESAGIAVTKRVVVGIGVPVVVLPILWCLRNRVRAQHASESGFINPPIHVNESVYDFSRIAARHLQ